jgi:hypothetical protein
LVGGGAVVGVASVRPSSCSVGCCVTLWWRRCGFRTCGARVRWSRLLWWFCVGACVSVTSCGVSAPRIGVRFSVSSLASLSEVSLLVSVVGVWESRPLSSLGVFLVGAAQGLHCVAVRGVVVELLLAALHNWPCLSGELPVGFGAFVGAAVVWPSSCSVGCAVALWWRRCGFGTCVVHVRWSRLLWWFCVEASVSFTTGGVSAPRIVVRFPVPSLASLIEVSLLVGVVGVWESASLGVSSVGASGARAQALPCVAVHGVVVVLLLAAAHDFSCLGSGLLVGGGAVVGVAAVQRQNPDF